MMNLLVYALIAATLFGVGFSTGWKVDSWKNGAAQTKAVEKAQVAQQQAENDRDVVTAERDRISARFEGKLDNLHIVNTTINKGIEREVITREVLHSSECTVPATSVSLLNVAIDAANGKARSDTGKPDASVPADRPLRRDGPGARGGSAQGAQHPDPAIWGVRPAARGVGQRSSDNPALAALNME